MHRAALGQPLRGCETEAAQAAGDEIGRVGAGPEFRRNFRPLLRIKLKHDLADLLRALHETKGRARLSRRKGRAANRLQFAARKSLDKEALQGALLFIRRTPDRKKIEGGESE